MFVIAFGIISPRGVLRISMPLKISPYLTLVVSVSATTLATCLSTPFRYPLKSFVFKIFENFATTLVTFSVIFAGVYLPRPA